MNSLRFRLIEFFVIFLLFPVAMAFSLALWVKILIGFAGFIYILFVLLKIEKVKIEVSSKIKWKKFWKFLLNKLLVVVIVSTGFMWQFDDSQLFTVPINKPGLWIIILFVYTFLSVYPQELVYRTFFFRRYQDLIQNEMLFIFINAIVFSFGHIFFKSILVSGLTLVGGIVFAMTYSKTRSTLLVSIEHAVYGCWLFTVGMGNILGFPS